MTLITGCVSITVRYAAAAASSSAHTSLILQCVYFQPPSAAYVFLLIQCLLPSSCSCSFSCAYFPPLFFFSSPLLQLVSISFSSSTTLVFYNFCRISLSTAGLHSF